ncbi:MAG: SGNH hydrolase domain-containing protein, partial [Actinomycetes bacterium]
GFAAVAAIGSAVLMWTMYVPGQDPSRVYYGTDTRASSLLVGALLAMLLLKRPVVERRQARVALHTAGIVAAGVLGYWWSTATEHSDWLYRGGFVVAAVLVAVVIASITQPKFGPLGHVLALKPLRFIGLISYGLYLWHWPVFIALSPTRVPLDGYALFAVRVAATLAIATLSYYLIEMPIRHGALKRLRLRPALLTPVLVMVVLAAIVFTTAGAPASPVEVSAAEVKAPKIVDTPTTGPAPPARVLLVGDSVANSLSPGFEHLAAADNFQLWNASVPGCGLATDLGQRYTAGWESQPPRCAPGWRDRWPAEVAQWNPKVVVVLLGAQDTFDRRVGSKVFPFDQASGQQLAMGELQQAVNILGKDGARVVFLTAPYYVLGWPEQIVVDRSHLNPAWIDRWNGFLRDTAAANPGKVTVLDLNKVLDPDGHWTDTVDGITVRISDRMHLTGQGADLAAQALMPQIRQLLGRGAAPQSTSSSSVPANASPPAP